MTVCWQPDNMDVHQTHRKRKHATLLFHHETIDGTVLGDPTDDDSSNNNEEANNDNSSTVPMTWNDESMKSLIDKLRQDMNMYIWWAENFWPRVVGLEKWKLEVASGNKKPSNVVTVSDEALALLLFENHFQSWKLKSETSDDTGSQTSSMTSDDSSTKYTRKNGSTKDGWSDDGIARFGQLMEKVTEDRASTNGTEFDRLVQEKMKLQSNNGKRKKRRRETDENRITMVVNELPDMPDSSDED